MGEREATIRALFDTSGLCLEIGPSYNPILPKREGYRVHTVDHAPAEELRAKYGDITSVDATLIEEVDFIGDCSPLSQAVGVPGSYDCVVASHVIEHTPDLLGFLIECNTLVKPGGVVVLAVPDKRRCFDIFRPLTSTGQVLQAHLERRRHHLPASAFDQAANMVTRNGAGGWMQGTTGDFTFQHSLSIAKELFDQSAQSDAFFDFHAWVFTPSSFRLIVQDLNSIGALSLRERTFQTTSGIEFWITLDQFARGCSLDRLSLLHNIRGELRELTDQPEGVGVEEA